MNNRLLLGVVMLLASGCSADMVQPSDPRSVPACEPGAVVASVAATPNPTTAGTPVDIVFTFDVFVRRTDYPSTCVSAGTDTLLYWSVRANIVNSVTPAPGTITPASGGPAAVRSPIHVTYSSPTPVEANVAITASTGPPGTTRPG